MGGNYGTRNMEHVSRFSDQVSRIAVLCFQQADLQNNADMLRIPHLTCNLPIKQLLVERCRSGRSGRFRKPVYRKVPWVRIPPSPLDKDLGTTCSGVFGFIHANRTHGHSERSEAVQTVRFDAEVRRAEGAAARPPKPLRRHSYGASATWRRRQRIPPSPLSRPSGTAWSR